MDIQFEPVSGRGRVHSWTVNRYAFNPDMPPPYILAEVELEEQRNLLLLSNLVGIDPALVRFGMPVQVEFDHVDDTWIPVFTA
jgi:uncharacterized OB-fold protein